MSKFYISLIPIKNNQIQESTLNLSLKEGSDCTHCTISIKLPKNLSAKYAHLNFVFNQRKTGTSALKRLRSNKHPKSYKAKELLKTGTSINQQSLLNILKNIDDSKKFFNLLGPVQRMVLTLCCSRHVLPLHFFEDPVICQRLNVKRISRCTVRGEIQKLSSQIEKDLFEKNRGQGLRWH